MNKKCVLYDSCAIKKAPCWGMLWLPEDQSVLEQLEEAVASKTHSIMQQHTARHKGNGFWLFQTVWIKP